MRGLQRCLASLCRAAAVHAAQASDHKAVEGGGIVGGVVLASPPEGPVSRNTALHPAAAALSTLIVARSASPIDAVAKVCVEAPPPPRSASVAPTLAAMRLAPLTP